MTPADYKFRDLELEKVVLATAFQHRLITERVFTSVSPEAFAYDDTRRLYKVCLVFWRKYFAVPQMSTLRRFLQQHSDRVDRKKRIAYETLFDELKHLKVSRSNFSFRLDQLLELQMRRELFETAQGVLSDFKQQEQAPKVLEHLMQRAFACHDQTGVDSVIRKPLSSEVPRERWLAYVDRRDHPERYKGIPYGFTELDEVSGGIRAPHLGMVFGRVGAGKSRTLFNIGCNASLADYPVMYVTIEMEHEILQFMWESRNAGIAMQDILNGQLTEREERQYKKVLKRLGQEKCPFYAVDIARGCSPGRIDHEYAVHTRLYGVPPALILVDYANLLSPDEPSRDRSERYDLVFRELKEVARARHVPILTAAQQNRQSLKARQVGTEHIGLSDMAGAHCDFILHVMLGYNPLEEAIAQSMRVLFLTYIKGRYHKLTRAKLFVDWPSNYIGDWSTFEEEESDG